MDFSIRVFYASPYHCRPPHLIIVTTLDNLPCDRLPDLARSAPQIQYIVLPFPFNILYKVTVGSSAISGLTKQKGIRCKSGAVPQR